MAIENFEYFWRQILPPNVEENGNFDLQKLSPLVDLCRSCFYAFFSVSAIFWQNSHGEKYLSYSLCISGDTSQIWQRLCITRNVFHTQYSLFTNGKKTFLKPDIRGGGFREEEKECVCDQEEYFKLRYGRLVFEFTVNDMLWWQYGFADENLWLI